MEIDSIQVVEYSVKQNCYHRHRFNDMLNKNMRNVFDQRSVDYVPIGVFKSVDEADDFIEWHREKMEKLKKSTSFLVTNKGDIIYVQKP